jgi:hypothetical protein
MNISGVQTLDTETVGTLAMTADQLAGFGTIDASDAGLQVLVAGAGTYDLTGKTFIGGNVWLDASQSSDDVTLIAGSQDTALIGSSGNTSYQFGAAFGQDTVINNGANNTAAGEIDFNGGLTDQNLWFQQSGSDLVIDELGTSQSVTVSNWFNGGGAQSQSINAGGDTLLNNQVALLVQAMASYADNNSGFNPATATAMPADTMLQAAIAANWQPRA